MSDLSSWEVVSWVMRPTEDEGSYFAGIFATYPVFAYRTPRGFRLTPKASKQGVVYCEEGWNSRERNINKWLYYKVFKRRLLRKML